MVTCLAVLEAASSERTLVEEVGEQALLGYIIGELLERILMSQDGPTIVTRL